MIDRRLQDRPVTPLPTTIYLFPAHGRGSEPHDLDP